VHNTILTSYRAASVAALRLHCQPFHMWNWRALTVSTGSQVAS